MTFIGSLRQLLKIFYRNGSQKAVAILIITLLGIWIELSGLMCLFLVVQSIIEQTVVVIFPIIHFSISLFNAVLVLVGVYFIKFIFSIWQSRFLLNYCYLLNYKITAEVIQHYYNQPTEIIKNTRLADALNKVFTIGGYFSEIIFQAVLIFFSELFLTLIIIIALVIFNYKLLFLLLLVLVPVCALLLYFSRKKLTLMSKQIMTDNVQYHQSIMTLMHGLLDIKLSGRYLYFFKVFNTKIAALHKTQKAVNLENNFPPKVLEFSAILGIATLFLVTFWSNNTTSMTNLLAAFATAAFRFIPSANRIIGSIQNIKLYSEYIDFIYKINPAAITPKDQNIVLDEIESIQLNNISFSYINRPVLKDISLRFNKGTITGITGVSGAGKSTLVNIISGLLEPQNGTIYLNEQPVTSAIKTALQHKSAFVKQEPYFLNGTIAENIVFGYDSIPNLDKVNHCIRSVNLDKWVEQQPNGLSAETGDHGTKLSGGQRQRLAIARALYRKAAILILDEPSNSLDSFNKHEILLLIKRLTQQNKLITIIVTHDTEVLQICDSIFELNTF